MGARILTVVNLYAIGKHVKMRTLKLIRCPCYHMMLDEITDNRPSLYVLHTCDVEAKSSIWVCYKCRWAKYTWTCQTSNKLMIIQPKQIHWINSWWCVVNGCQWYWNPNVDEKCCSKLDRCPLHRSLERHWFLHVCLNIFWNICMLKILQIKYFHRQATLLKGHVYCMELYNKCIWILDEHCKIQNVQWLSHDQLMGRLVSIIDSKI